MAAAFVRSLSAWGLLSGVQEGERMVGVWVLGLAPCEPASGPRVSPFATRGPWFPLLQTKGIGLAGF